MAVESDKVTGDMVESTEFPHLVQKYGVMGVPRTVINETTSFEGAVPEATFLAQVLKASRTDEALPGR
jgi:predicted DsbA family dithiol-disulfide isomerase